MKFLDVKTVLPELSHAFSIANEAGLSLEEQEAQWKRKDFIMLQKGSIELAEKKGKKKKALRLPLR